MPITVSESDPRATGSTTTTTPQPSSDLEVPRLPGARGCPPGTGTPGGDQCLAQKTPDGSFILPSFPLGIRSSCYSGYVLVGGGSTCVLDMACPSGTTKIGAFQCVVNKLLPATTTTTKALPAQTGNAGAGGTTTNTGGTTTTTTTPVKTGTTTGTGTKTMPTPATTTTIPTKPSTSTSSTTTTTTNVIR